MRIINFGSLNIDKVYQVEQFVRPGQTITAKDYAVAAGGKGLCLGLLYIYIVANNFYHINSIGKCRKSQGDTQILLAKKQGNSRGGCSIWRICQLCYVKRTS